MKKVYMLAFAAILSLSVCASGCKSPGKDAAKEEGKNAASEKGSPAGSDVKTEVAPAPAGAAAFGEDICKTAMQNPAAIGAMFSPKYMALVAMTAQQQNAMPKADLDKMLKTVEDSMKAPSSTPKPGEIPESCKVLDSKDIPCDELYKKIDDTGSMGTKFAPGRAKEVGDSLKAESCGLVTVTAKQKGKEEPIEWGVAKIDGKNSIIAGFQVTAK